ncbi:MAG: DEAD/DEAH box helicase [Candidatus Marinimicrobia bacterium]|nr:DEAD/DEAH box helicase [Candidatus Neomarinimicrobiota bacterium]
MNTFENTGLGENILKAIASLGFEKTTPIQESTIPILMTSNQDIIATAQTGTGKTAAFGLPMLHLTDIDDFTTQSLVLCPTRELCIQIALDLTNYAKYSNGINIVSVYGGASIENQIKALRKGAHIVIGTPGRTKDLIKRRKLKINSVVRVVLDEADEMLTMGFKEDLETILGETPKQKQTLLFSATMSQKVISITKKYMHNPLEISVAPMNVGAKNVKHIYYMVHIKDRYEAIKRIADSNPNIYGIVFCRTRRETKEVASKLMHDNYNADTLHGELSQTQRDEVMNRFRKHTIQILVATDVAARGLDVNDLTHIINYNLPDESEIYIHRSGRTGRAGKTGVSIAIIHTREMGRIKDIERKGGISFKRESVPNGIDICQKRLYALIDKIENVDVDEKQIGPFLPSIYEKLEYLDRENLIKHFVSAEFNRYLSYYKNSRDINVSSKNDYKSHEKKRKDISQKRQESSFSGYLINIGFKQQLNPSRLIGLVNECIGSKKAIIGNIDIMKTQSIIEVDGKWASKLLKGIKGKSFEGKKLTIEVLDKKIFPPTSAKKGHKSKRRNDGKAHNKNFKSKGKWQKSRKRK